MMLSKALFCLSTNLRGLTLLSWTTSTQRFHQSTSITDKVKRFSTKYLEDHLNTSNNEFKTTTIPSKVLYLLESNQKKVKGPDILAALSALSYNYRHRMLEKGFHKQDFFNNFSAIIHTNISTLQMHEVIQILKILNRIDVPSTSKLYLALFQHVDTLLNSASLQDLNSLSTIIVKMRQTPSTEAMIKNLNRKFFIRFSTDFDQNDLMFLSNALRYVFLNLKDKKIQRIIVEALCKNNFETTTVSCAASLITSLSHMIDYPSERQTILNRVQDFLIKHIQEMTITEIIHTLYKITDIIRDKRMEEFYNETLFNKCVERIVSSDASFEQSIDCLLICNKTRHVHKNLLCYVSAKFYEEKLTAESYTPYQIEKLLVLLTGLANLKYKPLFWDEIYESLKTRSLTFKYETLVFYAFHLSCLDCYDQAALDKIFETTYDFSRKAFMCWTSLKLWQKLNMLPNYDAPLLSQKYIESFKDLSIRTEKSILSSLEESMGGSMYVKRNLKTKLYHHIDFVVAFQSGEFPKAIKFENNNTEHMDGDIEYLENLRVPLNSQIIVILYIPPSWYTRNTGQLLGPYAVNVESLEALSYRVVTINGKIWHELQESSRIPFIMNEIKCKLTE